jgi:elongation factor Ts
MVHDISMHIAATDPRFIRKEDVTQEAIDKERDIQIARAINEGKPPAVAEKMVEGRLNKFYEEICLLEQPFVKEPAMSVGQFVKTRIAKLGENITVARFVRFKVGETTMDMNPAEPGGEEKAADR